MGITVNLADYNELVKISERERTLFRLYKRCVERNKDIDDEDEKLTGLPFETIALIMGWNDGTDNES